ncbi:hypothetical protein DEI99_000825 [Curtobacterium sp. MCLR17_036]|uniref:hypothetical protein n=1 Tax=Curtobacterium sp. MCLR17_036 TaxID=2175620 RepID=UPI000DA82C35|nr:hypothetical protein [Curtobacterium sp. MCLR17_036]WIE65103.1 hypothetical protein DEI99_000825 [Curtobacterium sp. MCLR17_036]
MTLTAILPTLRASVPDPVDPFLWPAHTVPTTDDVLVAAISMVRLADLAGTPCVHTAEQAPPRYRPRDWAPRDVSVAVASVARVRRPRPGVVLLELDAVLPRCAVLEQVRLIGRTSTAPLSTMYVVTRCDGETDGPFHRLPTPLPADVRAGDLVCFPCLATVRHRDVVEPVRAEVAEA